MQSSPANNKKFVSRVRSPLKRTNSVSRGKSYDFVEESYHSVVNELASYDGMEGGLENTIQGFIPFKSSEDLKQSISLPQLHQNMKNESKQSLFKQSPSPSEEDSTRDILKAKRRSSFLTNNLDHPKTAQDMKLLNKSKMSFKELMYS